MDQSSRIYIAGHTGLIGSAIVRKLKSRGYGNLILVERPQLELTSSKDVENFFEREKPEYVVISAGKVGGIAANNLYPADFITTNLRIQLNIIQSAYRTGVKKLILFGSSCMYPRECSQPMSEDLLFSGRLEPTSMAYAISKIAGVQMCLAFNKQYGESRFMPLIPNSVFGPNDNFDSLSGHVLATFIRRFHEAKRIGANEIVLWGTGTPYREFIYSDDVADACFWLLHNSGEEFEFPINIGVGEDYTIRELALMVSDVVGYGGDIRWDKTKPDGAPRKLLDISRMNKYGWNASIRFKDGLRKINEWYLLNGKR